ncbi:MAG: FAD-dependent oxidoreductase, partial [Albimonas sp.]|uniref:FAD-dependent oxidoreductase n=1 Tax=Albimonas sp. TaxID=1872425 RepID=UPI004057AB0B
MGLGSRRASCQSRGLPRSLRRGLPRDIRTSLSPMSYDVAVVGAGILGLAHALAAARLGKRVVVIERDAQANGASIRNFGFVTVNGQQAGD